MTNNLVENFKITIIFCSLVIPVFIPLFISWLILRTGFLGLKIYISYWGEFYLFYSLIYSILILISNLKVFPKDVKINPKIHSGSVKAKNFEKKRESFISANSMMDFFKKVYHYKIIHKFINVLLEILTYKYFIYFYKVKKTKLKNDKILNVFIIHYSVLIGSLLILLDEYKQKILFYLFKLRTIEYIGNIFLSGKNHLQNHEIYRVFWVMIIFVLLYIVLFNCITTVLLFSTHLIKKRVQLIFLILFLFIIMTFHEIKIMFSNLMKIVFYKKDLKIFLSILFVFFLFLIAIVEVGEPVLRSSLRKISNELLGDPYFKKTPVYISTVMTSYFLGILLPYMISYYLYKYNPSSIKGVTLFYLISTGYSFVFMHLHTIGLMKYSHENIGYYKMWGWSIIKDHIINQILIFIPIIIYSVYISDQLNKDNRLANDKYFSLIIINFAILIGNSVLHFSHIWGNKDELLRKQLINRISDSIFYGSSNGYVQIGYDGVGQEFLRLVFYTKLPLMSEDEHLIPGYKILKNNLYEIYLSGYKDSKRYLITNYVVISHLRADIKEIGEINNIKIGYIEIKYSKNEKFLDAPVLIPVLIFDPIYISTLAETIKFRDKKYIIQTVNSFFTSKSIIEKWKDVIDNNDENIHQKAIILSNTATEYHNLKQLVNKFGLQQNIAVFNGLEFFTNIFFPQTLSFIMNSINIYLNEIISFKSNDNRAENNLLKFLPQIEINNKKYKILLFPIITGNLSYAHIYGQYLSRVGVFGIYKFTNNKIRYLGNEPTAQVDDDVFLLLPLIIHNSIEVYSLPTMRKLTESVRISFPSGINNDEELWVNELNDKIRFLLRFQAFYNDYYYKENETNYHKIKLESFLNSLPVFYLYHDLKAGNVLFTFLLKGIQNNLLLPFTVLLPEIGQRETLLLFDKMKLVFRSLWSLINLKNKNIDHIIFVNHRSPDMEYWKPSLNEKTIYHNNVTEYLNEFFKNKLLSSLLLNKKRNEDNDPNVITIEMDKIISLGLYNLTLVSVFNNVINYQNHCDIIIPNSSIIIPLRSSPILTSYNFRYQYVMRYHYFKNKKIRLFESKREKLLYPKPYSAKYGINCYKEVLLNEVKLSFPLFKEPEIKHQWIPLFMRFQIKIDGFTLYEIKTLLNKKVFFLNHVRSETYNVPDSFCKLNSICLINNPKDVDIPDVDDLQVFKEIPSISDEFLDIKNRINSITFNENPFLKIKIPCKFSLYHYYEEEYS